MKNRMKLAAVACAFTLLLAESSQATLALVNDFESGLTGINSNGSVSIVTDPDVGTNNALEIFGIADAHVPGFTIADNSIGTLFVRARLTDAGTAAFGSKGSFGLTDNDWTTADSQFRDYYNVRTRVGSVNGFIGTDRATFTGAYDGNSYAGGDNANIQGPAPDAWQNFWFVLDTTADTFDLYVEGGSFGTQTQVANDLAWYRDDLADTSGVMVAFYIEAISGGTETYIDDIYVDATGVDLTNPLTAVPEPSSFLFGLTVLGLVLRQRQRQVA